MPEYERFEEEASPVIHHIAGLKKRVGWLLCLNFILLFGVGSLLVVMALLLHGLVGIQGEVNARFSQVGHFIDDTQEFLGDFEKLTPLINGTLTTMSKLIDKFRPCLDAILQWCHVPQRFPLQPLMLAG